MSTAIIFPDVELWACGYLRTALAAHGFPGMYVSNRYAGRTTEVWVRRDGGRVLDDTVREAPRLGINAFAQTEQGATDLARTVSAILLGSANGLPICKAEQVLGPSPVADTLPRRFMTFEFVVRGVAL